MLQRGSMGYYREGLSRVWNLVRWLPWVMMLQLRWKKHGDSSSSYIKAKVSLSVSDPGGSDLDILAPLLCRSRQLSRPQGHVAPPCLHSGNHMKRTVFLMTLACLSLALLTSAASNYIHPLHLPVLSDQTSDDTSLFLPPWDWNKNEKWPLTVFTLAPH